jgi:hypothetical protein
VTGITADKTFTRWTAEQVGLSVEYPLEVMDQIRTWASESKRQFAGGGLDVGGVLFGKHESDLVRVMAWRPIACEHAEGPSLILSAEDRRDLVSLLLAAKQDPGLENLQPVGWFLSNMRGGVSMSPSAVEIFDGYFTEPWQVTLVLLPAMSGTASAGFFVREPGGKLRTESSYSEFALEPPPTAEARVDAAPAITPPKKAQHFRWLWAIPTVIAMILAGLLINPQPHPAPPPSEPFRLEIRDDSPGAKITWDAKSSTVLAARGAEIVIQAGGPPLHFKLTNAQLQEGKMLWPRHEGNVDASLTVFLSGGASVREYAHLQVKTIMVTALPPPDTHEEELKKLETELHDERVRSDKLKNMVKILENRISVDGSRKP